MTLGMAPLALGKAVHDVYPVRRNGHQGGAAIQLSANQVAATEAEIAKLEQLIGLNRGSGVEINFLWVNLGGGAATTVLGAAKTVTVTQTVVGGAATAPPAAITSGAASATITSPPSGTTVVSSGATHSVTVGGPGGLAFTPAQISATPGDTVIFTFLSQNHTATQSSFDTPCQPLAGGMDSGFQPNPNNTVNPPPQVAMQVMVSTPLWFYCRQKGHCGKGMVFSINPTANKTQAAFQSMAIQQNGQGAGSAITGGSSSNSSSSSGSGAGSSSNAGAAASTSATLAQLPGATTSAGSAAGAASTGVVTGSGQVAADGSCVCAVQCSFPGFPNAQVQGRDSFGGFGGGVPMAMVPARFRA
ncbi:a92c044e-de2e-4a32-9146-64d7f78753ef [Thermothielavioides terrestris]|nr:a92c044e-de2e-4a32-9146-64d7f78753ef [Thermothielavioides terrestris]